MSGSATTARDAASVLHAIREKRIAAARTATVEEVQPLAVNTRGAAKYLGVSPSSVRKWRRVGSGPPWIRLSSNLVVYELGALTTWLRAQR